MNVQDTTPPALQLNNQTLEATGPTGATATYTPTARDLVDGTTDAVSCDTPSGTTFPIATTTVTCHTADAAGNKATGSFTVTVGDHTAPALSLTDASAEATQPAGADVTYSASATDIVDGARPVDCTPASGSTFPIAVTTVGCSSSDTRGKRADGSLKVTVTDHTPPSVTVTDQKAEATGADGAAVTFPATATDIVDGTDTVTCDHTSGSTFPLGVTTVSCSATDAHSNTGRGSFTVTVKDTTAPVLTLGDKSAEATGPNGAAVSFSPTAADIVDVTDPVTCDATSGSTLALGSTTVHCSTKDKAGNPASGSFTVTVVDTTAPVLSVKDVTAEATSAAGAPVSYTATAADLVDGATTVTCTPASGSPFKLGDTAVSCSTADRRQPRQRREQQLHGHGPGH